MTYSLTISARSKSPTISAQNFLAQNFASIPLGNIDSIFGFSAPCRMYGGRQFVLPEISDADLDWLYANGIGYRIPLTNHFIDDEMYQEGKKFLQKHHRKGNSIILFREDIAARIKEDFPLYSIECSVIKEVNSLEKLEKALEIFDTVVPLPEVFNDNFPLLASLSQEVKDRVRLFISMGCSYNCPARICYSSFSKINRGDAGAKFECSQMDNRKNYVPNGMTFFDMDEYINMGFSKFKMLRVKPSPIPTGF
jgi:hypothetical protein